MAAARQDGENVVHHLFQHLLVAKEEGKGQSQSLPGTSNRAKRGHGRAATFSRVPILPGGADTRPFALFSNRAKRGHGRAATFSRVPILPGGADTRPFALLGGMGGD